MAGFILLACSLSPSGRGGGKIFIDECSRFTLTTYKWESEWLLPWWLGENEVAALLSEGGRGKNEEHSLEFWMRRENMPQLQSICFQQFSQSHVFYIQHYYYCIHALGNLLHTKLLLIPLCSLSTITHYIIQCSENHLGAGLGGIYCTILCSYI